MEKVIITAALVGNGTMKDKCPSVPYSAEEIARDAVACAKAGAAIIHIHVRDKEGKATMDTELFAAAHAAAREALNKEGLDAILNLSTGGIGSDELRTAHIERIKPEIEIFDTAMFQNVFQDCKDGVLKAPCHFQFIMGIPGGMPGSIKNVSFLLDCMPEGSTWSITGIGKAHIPMMLTGLAAGAHGIHVGLEDNIWMSKGVPATNELLVRRAAELCKIAGREIAAPREAREILGVKQPE